MSLEYKSLLKNHKFDQDNPDLEWFISSDDNSIGDELFEKETGFEFLSFEPTISNSGKVTILKTEKEEEKIKFEMNLRIWNYQTSLMANNRFDNDYFNEIVNMKEAAVPYILKELQKGPTPLVHALSIIYPDMVKCEGYVPLDALCCLWEDILTKTVEP